MGGHNIIEVGWRKNNIINGNYAKIKEEEMKVDKNGWF